jgi:hypothetical protein
MEILITTINFILLLALILSPIFLLNRLSKRKIKNTFIPYLAIATIITFILVLLMAWWTQFSTELLLSHYGYNSDFLTETERIKDIAFENLDRVKELHISKMGIGWPLKAFMFYSTYFPYILIVYFGSYIYKRIKSKS